MFGYNNEDVACELLIAVYLGQQQSDVDKKLLRAFVITGGGDNFRVSWLVHGSWSGMAAGLQSGNFTSARLGRGIA